MACGSPKNESGNREKNEESELINYIQFLELFLFLFFFQLFYKKIFTTTWWKIEIKTYKKKVDRSIKILFSLILKNYFVTSLSPKFTFYLCFLTLLSWFIFSILWYLERLHFSWLLFSLQLPANLSQKLFIYPPLSFPFSSLLFSSLPSFIVVTLFYAFFLSFFPSSSCIILSGDDALALFKYYKSGLLGLLLGRMDERTRSLRGTMGWHSCVCCFGSSIDAHWR